MTSIIQKKEEQLSSLANAFIKAVAGDNIELAKQKFESLFISSSHDYTTYPNDAFNEAIAWIENPDPIEGEDLMVPNQRNLTSKELKLIETLRQELAPNLKVA